MLHLLTIAIHCRKTISSLKMLWCFSCLFHSTLRLILYALFCALKSATYTLVMRKSDWRFLNVLRLVGNPKERAKVTCNDMVLETVRKTGKDSEAGLKLFVFYCSSWALKSLQIGWTFQMEVVKKWKAVKKRRK